VGRVLGEERAGGTDRVHGVDFPRGVCATRPFSAAYPGDRFTITRPTFAVVHHSDGSVERFADGYLTHRDTRSAATFRHDGWISTRIFAGGRACRESTS
jgi:hypothetical protein